MRPPRRLAIPLIALAITLASCNSDNGTTGPVGPAPSLTLSTIASTATQLVGDGTSTATISVTVRDANGTIIQPTNGGVIILASKGRMSMTTGNGAGVYSAVLTAPTATGPDTVWARLRGVVMPANVLITLVAGPPDSAHSPLTAGPDRILADGKSTAAVCLVERDPWGNVATGGTVTMTATKGALSAVELLSNDTFCAQLTATGADDSAIVSALLDGAPFGVPAVVQFVTHDIWIGAPQLPLAREYFGLAEIGGILYAAGGDSTDFKSGILRRVDAYDPATDRWTARAPMMAPRRWFASAVAGGLMYAVGGDNLGMTRSVESYDPNADAWTGRAPMPTARKFLGATVVNGILFAIGGLAGQGLSSKVEAYDPATDRWSTLADMPTPREFMSVTAVDGLIYVLGGNASYTPLKTVEVFNPATGTWSVRPQMPVARYDAAVAVLGGKIYVMGGMDANENMTDRVDIYDPATDHWTVGRPLPSPRYGASATVVGGRIYVVAGGYGIYDYYSYTPSASIANVDVYVP